MAEGLFYCSVGQKSYFTVPKGGRLGRKRNAAEDLFLSFFRKAEDFERERNVAEGLFYCSERRKTWVKAERSGRPLAEESLLVGRLLCGQQRGVAERKSSGGGRTLGFLQLVDLVAFLGYDHVTVANAYKVKISRP